MKMNKLAIAVSAAVLALSANAHAELSANIGLTSDYMWRGVTQNGHEAAISGGVDFSHESGFYAGLWTSSLGGAGAGAEVDLYGGIGGEVATDFSYDLGLIYYAYPSGKNLNFTELYGSLSYGPVTGGVAYTVDSDWGIPDNDLYYYVSASTEVVDTWTVGGTVGRYDKDAGGSANDYTHYQLDITKSAGDFGDFTLSGSIADGKTAVYDEDLTVFVSWAKTF